MTPTIYEKYGGQDFFHDCIYSLYLDMFDHPEISYHFIGVDIFKLSLHQTHFLIRSIGGPDLYKGQTLDKVHRDLDITPFQFQEIAKAFREVFLSKGVSPEDTEVIMQFVSSFEKEVVTEKTSLIDRIMLPLYRLKDRILELFR